ncbi:MAG: lipocalin family protein [Caldimonas sp.]
MARRLRPIAVAIGIGATAALLVACATPAGDKALPPVALAPHVDLPRFMGDWYVIASIPTMFEKNAYSARESYRLDADGTIDTTFAYRSGSFDGTPHALHSRGYVLAPSNAVWGQQYVWPFKADYRISFVADDYGTTVITREKRDYVWIMARTPTIPEAEYQRLVAVVEQQGYDAARLRRVPQQPSAGR